MSHRLGERAEAYGVPLEMNPRIAELYATAAGFYAACIKNRYFEEADEFAEWFLDAFDIDLEN